MNQHDKRKLENELTVMGLPGIDDPNLVQALADVVNGYPFAAERVEFFCEFLNECEGSKRTEMYEALRPRLSFPVPSLAECETRIVAKAERMVDKRLGSIAKVGGTQEALPEVTLKLVCAGCGKEAEFRELTTPGAMLEARKAGWGRGPIRWQEYCSECRLLTMLPSRMGPALTRRNAHA